MKVNLHLSKPPRSTSSLRPTDARDSNAAASAAAVPLRESSSTGLHDAERVPDVVVGRLEDGVVAKLHAADGGSVGVRARPRWLEPGVRPRAELVVVGVRLEAWRGCRGVRSQPRTGSPTPRRRQISATTHARRPPKAGRWGSTCPSTIDAASRRSRRRRRRALRRRPRWRCLWKRAARGTTERDARTRNSPSKTRRAASETMREARASSRRIPPRASLLRTTWRDLMWRRTGRVVPRPTGL